MIKIEQLTLEQIKMMYTISKWKTVTNYEVGVMESYMRMLIDEKVEICRTCPSQIQFSFARYTGWLKSNEPAIEKRKAELEQQLEPKFCLVCNANLEDKRMNYCSPSCKKKAAKMKIK